MGRGREGGEGGKKQTEREYEKWVERERKGGKEYREGRNGQIEEEEVDVEKEKERRREGKRKVAPVLVPLRRPPPPLRLNNFPQ